MSLIFNKINGFNINLSVLRGIHRKHLKEFLSLLKHEKIHSKIFKILGVKKTKITIHYIYYFEIENLGQLSFHSENLFENIPEFPGRWIGKINEKFPFNLRDVKKLIKSEV